MKLNLGHIVGTLSLEQMDRENDMCVNFPDEIAEWLLILNHSELTLFLASTHNLLYLSINGWGNLFFQQASMFP